MKLDSVDCRILDLLQASADRQVGQLATQVGLSQTSCWRRIQRLRESGVIARSVALLNPKKVNLGITALVAVRTNSHSQEWLDRFKATVEAIPEVVEFYRMSGEIDYMLRVVVPDLSAYDAIYKRLIAVDHIRDISASFAIEEIKFTTALPLSHAA